VKGSVAGTEPRSGNATLGGAAGFLTAMGPRGGACPTVRLTCYGSWVVSAIGRHRRSE